MKLRGRATGVSAQFERFAIILVSCLACYRLVLAVYAPGGEHLPNAILLAITLVVVGYLWWGKSRALTDLLRLT